jgi:hypothetical protein
MGVGGLARQLRDASAVWQARKSASMRPNRGSGLALKRSSVVSIVALAAAQVFASQFRKSGTESRSAWVMRSRPTAASQHHTPHSPN